MDTTKQNPLQGAQESDDLIAELARLVAKDARSTSANSAVYERAPEPEPQPEPEPELDIEEPVYGEAHEAEPVIDAGYQPYEPVASEPEAPRQEPDQAFDFGFDVAQKQAEREFYEEVAAGGAEEERDEIADLIASVERDDTPLAEEESDELFYGEPQVPGYAPAPDAGYYSEPDIRFPDVGQPHRAAETGAESRDPLSEIEALIGEAAHVSANAGLNGGRKVRSSFLDTADYQDIQAERAVDTADAAIAAAAEASRASFEPPLAEPREPQPQQQAYQREPEIDFAAERAEVPQDAFHARAEPEAFEEFVADERPERGNRLGGFIVPVAAGTVILALLVGGYFVFLSPTPVPSEAPVLTAESGEFKEVPDQTAAPTTASESVIFNEIDGNRVSPEDEALVSRDQTNGATGAEIGRVIAPEEGEATLANRPVRTVTVRPDGTIVMTNDSVAGSNVLPVDRPDVPTVPNGSPTNDPIADAIAAAMPTEVAEAQPALPVATPDPVPAQPAQPEAAASGTVGTPIPIARPQGLGTPATQTAAVQQQPATTTTTPTPAPAATTTNASAGAWVQLASQRTEEGARADIPMLQSRYGALFNGTALDVSRVDLGERGVYYRVRLPQPSMADANSVCNAIKAQGGDCFVLNN